MPSGDLSNAIGERGEAIFATIMTKFHGKQPLFRRPSSLGDKWPLVDYVCELYGPWKKQRPFFFVQVKTTQRGYTKKAGRLKVGVSKERARGLTAYKVPVYLAGVDETSERVYIVAAAGRITGLSSLHTGTELDRAGRLALWKEVRRYWFKIQRPANWTALKEPLWK